MKQFLLLSSLFLVLQGTAQTGVYHPYPYGYALTWEWEKLVNNGQFPTYDYVSYKWLGDSVVNGVQYYSTNQGIVYQDVIAEEAFYLESLGNPISITLDLNLVVGDTFITHMLDGSVPFFPIANDTNFVLTAIDSIEIGGVYRSKYSMSPLFDLFSTYQFVSGVGFTSYDGFEFGGYVYCHTVNNNPLIGGGQFDAPCQLSVEKEPEVNFRLAPNPVNNKVKFSMAVDQIVLYTMDGQCVLNRDFTNSLDVSGLPTGVYIAKIRVDDTSITRKIFKY